MVKLVELPANMESAQSVLTTYTAAVNLQILYKHIHLEVMEAYNRIDYRFLPNKLLQIQ